MIADIVVDLRDIARVFGIKVGDEKRLNGRGDVAANGSLSPSIFGGGFTGAACATRVAGEASAKEQEAATASTAAATTAKAASTDRRIPPVGKIRNAAIMQ
jgi:hypothetical protein